MDHLDSSRSIQVDMLSKVDFGEASLSQQAYQAIATKLFPYTFCHDIPFLRGRFFNIGAFTVHCRESRGTRQGVFALMPKPLPHKSCSVIVELGKELWNG